MVYMVLFALVTCIGAHHSNNMERGRGRETGRGGRGGRWGAVRGGGVKSGSMEVVAAR